MRMHNNLPAALRTRQESGAKGRAGEARGSLLWLLATVMLLKDCRCF